MEDKWRNFSTFATWKITCAGQKNILNASKRLRLLSRVHLQEKNAKQLTVAEKLAKLLQLLSSLMIFERMPNYTKF